MDSGNVGSVADQFADRDEASIALSCGVICPPWLPRVVHGADNPLLTNAANPKLSLAAWLPQFQQRPSNRSSLFRPSLMVEQRRRAEVRPGAGPISRTCGAP